MSDYTVVTDIKPAGIQNVKLTINRQNIGAITFVGSFIDDMTTSGQWTGSVEKDYRVQIDGTSGTDTFKWSDDNGVSWIAAGIPITAGVPQLLENGIYITFVQDYNHGNGDYWNFSTVTSNLKEFQLLDESSTWSLEPILTKGDSGNNVVLGYQLLLTLQVLTNKFEEYAADLYDMQERGISDIMIIFYYDNSSVLTDITIPSTVDYAMYEVSHLFNSNLPFPRLTINIKALYSKDLITESGGSVNSLFTNTGW